ncbi:MAG: ABC transporter substrate-binding protein [Verrucomicrobiota bacterium]
MEIKKIHDKLPIKMKLFNHTFLAALALIIMTVTLHAEDKKLVVGHDLWIGYSGAFVADAKGFFKEAGLDVEFKQFPGPGDTLPALISGKLDIGLTTLHNLALASLGQKKPLTSIYLLDTSNGADAIVAKESIKSVKDLKGKKVAATDGEINHMMLIAALDKHGMTQDDIEFVNMNADDAGGAFVAGKLDAAVTWEPWVTKAKSAGGNVIFTSADIPDTILDSVAVTPEVMKSKKAELEAFLAAIDKGVAYLRKNEKESAEIIGKVLDTPAPDIINMLATDKIYDMKENKELHASGKAKASLDKVTSFLINKKLIKDAEGAEALLTDSFVK